MKRVSFRPQIRRFSRAACLMLAVAPVAALFTATPALAANGTADYFDVNGTAAGFGTPVNTTAYTMTGAFWDTNAAGTGTPAAWATNSQMTIGATASDFSGSTINIALDSGNNLNGLLVNSNNVTVNLTLSTANTHLNAAQTWTIAAGSTLTLNDGKQNFDPAGTVKSLNWNNQSVTFQGGGTFTFITPFAANTGGGATTQVENMPGGTINLDNATFADISNYNGNFTLTAGTLNFMSAGSALMFNGFTSGHTFNLNGGIVDNTSGSPLTLATGAGGYTVGGDFTFTGTSSINLGTSQVVLTGTHQVTVANNTFTVGGVISDGGGNFGLTKAGSGALVFTNNNTYTGNTTVNAGTLDVSSVSGGYNLAGSQALINNATVIGNVTANATGQTITGTGSYTGNLTVSNGCFTAGSVNAIGTTASLTNLTVSGSGQMKVKIGGASSDTITSVSGTATFDGNTNLIVQQTAAPTASSYTIFTAASIVGLTPGTFEVLGRTTYSIDAAGLAANSLVIDAAGGPGTLTWTGADGTSPTQWDNTQTAHNWNGTAPSGDVTRFFDGDFVTFNNTGATNAINISGTVNPGTTSVTAGTYSFSGGSIGGAGSLSVSGGANVSLNAANTYSGGTNLASGSTLNINNNGALGTGALTINGGTLNNTSGTAVVNSSANPITITSSFAFTGSTADLNLGSGVVTLSASPTITVSAGNFTLGGNITGGASSITKNGPGTLILSGTTGTYSGGVVINAGAVQAFGGSAGNTTLGSGNTTVNANGTLIGGGTDAFGFATGFSPATISIAGGTVTDLGTSSYRVTLPDIHFTAGGIITNDPSNTGNQTGNNTGQFSLFAGTVETDASSTQAVISVGNVSLQHGNTTFTVASGTVSGGVDLLVSSNLLNFNATAGAVIKTGPGKMVLSGTNLYTGSTTVNAGILALVSSTTTNNIGNSTNINVTGTGVLDVSQITASGGFNLAGNQTLTNNNSVVGTVTVNANQLATGTGTYGDIILNGGNVTPGTNTAIGTLAAGNLTVSSGSLKLKFSGATADRLNLSGTTNIANSNIAVAQLATTTTGNYVVLTSTGALTNITPGLLTSVGRVTYTIDNTALASNTIQLDVAGGPAHVTWTGADTGTDSTSWNNTQNNANWTTTDPVLDTTHYYDGDFVTFNNSATVQTVSLNSNLAPGSISVTGGNYSFTGGGNITGSTGLSVANASLTLSNTNYSYTGVTTIGIGGKIVTPTLGNGTSNSTIGNPGAAGSAASLVLDGGTLTWTGTATQTSDRGFTLTTNGGTIDTEPTVGADNLTLSGPIVLSGAGAHVLTLTGTDVTPLAIGGNVIGGAIADAAVGQPTSIVKNGNNAFNLGGASTFTGGITINQGRIRTNAAPTATTSPIGLGNISVANGAALYLNNAGTYTNNISVQGIGPTEGTVSALNNFGAIRLAASGVIIAGNVTLTGDTRITARGSTATTGSTISGQISGGFNLELGNNNSLAILVISNPVNNYTGNTTVSMSTTKIGAPSTATTGVIPHGTGTGNVIINGGDANGGTASSTLDLNGNNLIINGLSSSGTVAMDLVANSVATPVTFTVGDNNASGAFAGTIQAGTGAGTISLSKMGSGTETLSNAQAYTGNTSINGGTLALDATATLASVNISVGAAGTFSIAAGGNIPVNAALINNGIVNFNDPTRSLATLDGTTIAASVNLNSTVLTVTTGGSYAGSISGTGGLIVPVGAVQTTGSVNANSLEVDGKQAFTNTTVRTLSKVNSLTVAGSPGSWSGSLDLTSSRLIVEDSANHAADLVTYKNMVANSVNGTVGIYSSTAAGNGQVVVVSDNAVRLASFGAAGSNFGTGIGNVDASSILITTAVLGDANLDGVVDIKDLQDLANHWQQPATDWSQADFDGNGVVALQDLQALANHWQNGVGAPGQGSGESFSEALSLVGQFGGSSSSVPEPMSLAILGLGGVILAARRRKA